MNPKYELLLVAPVLLFSFVAHEYAHGYAALRQGDNTAQLAGRLTWNPLKHIDPFFTLIMPAITFLASGIALGGAKPCPINPNNYRNYRRGDIIVSLAGVTANFLLAIALTIFVVLFGLAGRAVPALETSFALLQIMFLIGASLNLLLVSFNLIPIPPLDGSSVVKHFLPPSWALHYQRIGPFGLVGLILLLKFYRTPIDLWMQPLNSLAAWSQHLVTPFLLNPT